MDPMQLVLVAAAMSATPTPSASGIQWGSVAEWVSGIGSLAAALSALYISAESRRIRLSGYCGVRVIVQQGMPLIHCVSIGATNVGTRATKITNVGMRAGPFWQPYKLNAIINLPRDVWSDGIPFDLPDGQSAKWTIVLDDEYTWIRELANGLLRNSRGVCRNLRFLIFTSHGTKLIIKPDDSLFKELWKYMPEKRKLRIPDSTHPQLT